MEHPHRVFKDEFGVLVSIPSRRTVGLGLIRVPVNCRRASQLVHSYPYRGHALDVEYHFDNNAQRCECKRLTTEPRMRTFSLTQSWLLFSTCVCTFSTKQIHDTLATCGWHATHCVSNTHGDDPVVISTANEGALCNECLVQVSCLRRWEQAILSQP